MRTWSNDATATLAQRQKMSWDFGRSRHFKNGNPENSLKRRANETQSEKQMDTVQDQLGELRAFLKGKLNSPPINDHSEIHSVLLPCYDKPLCGVSGFRVLFVARKACATVNAGLARAVS